MWRVLANQNAQFQSMEGTLIFIYEIATWIGAVLIATHSTPSVVDAVPLNLGASWKNA